MKAIEITYEVITAEDRHPVKCEACCTQMIASGLADWLASGETSEVADMLLGELLDRLEHLRNRLYVSGSIKDIRIVE